MNVDLDELRRRLPSAKQIAADFYSVKWQGNRAKCPRAQNHAHGDRDPSFAYLPEKDRLHCFSQGCFGDKPVDAFDFVGQMENCDFPETARRLAEQYGGGCPSSRSKKQATVRTDKKSSSREQLERGGWIEVAEYNMGDGVRKVRFEHPGRLQPKKNRPEKTFLWEHRAEGETWKAGRGGRPHFAYVNSVFRERDKLEWALGVESERSSDSVGKLGFPAFSYTDITEQNAKVFAGLDLCLLPDKDEAGKKMLLKAIALLQPHSRSIKVAEPPEGWPTAGDLHDAISEMAWGHDQVTALFLSAKPVAERTTEDHEALRTAKARKIESAPAAEFSVLGDDRYRLSLPAFGVVFEVDRLRRERGELVGELCVRCDFPSARTVDGTLSVADFNLSSLRSRSERAIFLAKRANAAELDWVGFVEEFCQRVLQADRAGQPAVDLRSLPCPTSDDEFLVEGLRLLRRHPSILFGDGGAAKSYLGLYLAGVLAQRGMRLALFDWELAGEDHRDRLERLFGDRMPQILYARCERPLMYETDRLRRIVRENNIEYSLYDSVAFACDGPPESAEIAGRYFRATRQIGGGSLHIAHISKSENADQKPFGSVFWHNGARSTWYANIASSDASAETLSLGLFNRKANLGRLQPPIGFTVSFAGDRTTFCRAEIAVNPDLAAKLSVRERMAALLKSGAMTPDEVATQIAASVETVKRTARRYKEQFTVTPDGRFALFEMVAS